MTIELPGADDIVDDTGDETEQPIGAAARKSLKVPGNILPWIEQAAAATGMPRDLLAVVVYQHSRFSGLTPGIIAEVAQRISDAYDAVPSGMRQYPGEGQANESALWLDAATTYAYGATTSAAAKAYRGELANVYGGSERLTFDRLGKAKVVGKAIGIDIGPDVKLPSGRFQVARFPGGIGGGIGGGAAGGTAKEPLIPGLSDNAAYAVQRIADNLYLQYLGRVPTNEEYINVSKNGWTTDTLETWLRGQPHPGGGTVGQFNDVQALARKYAPQWMGREPDAGELAYLVANGLTSADQIDAYYTQLKERLDTGDPAFAWAADPTTWRDTERQVQSLWQKAGLTGVVDPHLVNSAAGGKWSLDQVQHAIDLTPAPGYAQGVTIGQVNQVKPIALGYKSTIGGGDPTPLTPTEIAQFIGMNPMQIRDYYRSLPAMSSEFRKGATVAEPQTQAGTTTTPPPAPVVTTVPPPKPETPKAPPPSKTQVEGAKPPTPTDATRAFLSPFGYK